MDQSNRQIENAALFVLEYPVNTNAPAVQALMSAHDDLSGWINETGRLKKRSVQGLPTSAPAAQGL